MNKSHTNLKDAKVLIVDDVPANLDILSHALEKSGYNILVATGGKMAITVAQRSLPDLILLDVMMPEIDGLETCKRLKATPETQNIPVIFLTARTDMDDVVQGFELGAVDYVTKPFNTTELLARVNTHLTIHRLQKTLEQRVEEIARMKREHEAFLRHELRNHITPILGYTQMVLEECTSEKQKRYASMILESSEIMANMIESMRKLQEFEAGQYELVKKEIELDHFVAQVVSGLETTLADQIKIECQNHLENPVIEADASLLKGVFQNLIQNAVEHVTDLEDSSQRRVRICLENENGSAVFKVNNGGEPVPAERLASFFEKFNSTKRKKGGTGLGTSYAHLVTVAHGGEISVASNHAEGTTVTIQLPQTDS